MSGLSRSLAPSWVLRVAAASVFVGHGIHALRIESTWVRFFHTVGMSTASAERWMPLIGAFDLVLAAVVLIRPVRILLLWMVFWGLWTAALRPLSGDSIWQFFERGGNWGAPLALLLLLGWPRSKRAWLT